MIGGLNIKTDGTIVYAPGRSDLPTSTFTAADKGSHTFRATFQ